MFFDIITTKDGMSLAIRPETLTIKVFRDIYDRDKSKNKDNAIKDFSYIYHTCDYNSPYSNYIEEEKIEKVIDEVITGKYKADKLVLEACERYKELLETPASKMLNVIKDKVNESIVFLSNLEIESDKDVKLMQTMTKDFTTFMNSYKQLEDLVNKEKSGINDRIKGDKKINSRYAE
jgi:hypothetical protein